MDWENDSFPFDCILCRWFRASFSGPVGNLSVTVGWVWGDVANLNRDGAERERTEMDGGVRMRCSFVSHGREVGIDNVIAHACVFIEA